MTLTATDFTPEPTTTTTPSKAEALRKYVSAKVTRLQSALLGDNPKQQARARMVLAKLRQAPTSGGPVHSEAWRLALGETGLAAAGAETSEQFPKQLEVNTDEPGNYELAAYTALVSYAIHQQSRVEPMHMTNTRFAVAVGQLVARTTPSMKTRFDSLCNARTRATVNAHLRNLITVLRAEAIGFNYGYFAADLAQLYNPKHRDAPLMRFSREFVNGYFQKNQDDAATPTTAS